MMLVDWSSSFSGEKLEDLKAAKKKIVSIESFTVILLYHCFLYEL